jgi:SHS2 domain-containing protein
MDAFRLLDHTADIGIEARATSIEGLFVQAAHGLRMVLFGDCPVQSRREEPIEVNGQDYEELLVNWLNEILYRFEIGRLAPATFLVEELGETRLRGRVLGEDFDPLRHPLLREVKAVTHHQLAIVAVNGGWQTRIYLDL